MNIQLLTARAMLVALVAEVIWAGFVGYEVHRAYAGPNVARLSMPCDVQVLNFMRTWAEPAIAILMIVWLADQAASALGR